jgi:TPR repeat protein
MRRISVLLFLVLLTGCNPGSGLTGLFGSADLVHARNLFNRAQQRDSTSISELAKLAGKGDAYAAFYAGLANDPGVVKPGDPAKAAAFYQSVVGKFSGAKHNLALLILKGVVEPGQNTSTALELLSGAASKDRIESMLMLASLYDNGWEGIERNPALAAEWYERAMTFENDPRAVARLGAAYQDGIGKTQDEQQAKTYLLAAAEAGISEAQYRMARTVTDPLQAAQWLTVAALGDPRYEKVAIASLADLSVKDQMFVKHNAELWRYAHQNRTDLVSFSSPVLDP